MTSQVFDELAQPRCWLKPEFGPKERPVAGELTHRLGLVALGQVDLDEGGTCSLPQRLGPHSGARRHGRLRQAASGDKAHGEGVQGMQAKLPPVFGLDQHPIVVPVGQQIGRKSGDGSGAQVGIPQCGRSIEQPVSERPRLADIDGDALSKPEFEPVSLQGPPTDALQS
jgi:hypothetical protein